MYGFASGDPVNFSDPFGLCPYQGGCNSPLYYVLRFFGVNEAHAARTESVLRAGAMTAGAPGAGAAVRGIASAPTNAAAATISVSKAKYPESAAHIENAQAAGKPSVLTIDRAGAATRRTDALEGVPSVAGKDRDEYPPAMFQEGGRGASVQYVSPGDNRGAGACIGNQCRVLPDATRVQIKVTPDE